MVGDFANRKEPKKVTNAKGMKDTKVTKDPKGMKDPKERKRVSK